MNKLSEDQKNAVLFMQLILTFQGAAMQQMGKIKNPLTDKIERDLTQAAISIDMLDMIKQKTAGNLTKEEQQLIDHILSELKLNYVDELDREKKEKGKEGKDENKKKE